MQSRNQPYTPDEPPAVLHPEVESEDAEDGRCAESAVSSPIAVVGTSSPVRSFFSFSRLFGSNNKEKEQFKDFMTTEGSITASAWTSMGPGSAASLRVQTLKQLQQVAKKRTLQVSTIEGIWHETRDMICDPELREPLIQVMIELTHSQFNHIGMGLRQTFFETIRAVGCQESTVKWLNALTEDGKNVEGFEPMMDDMITCWVLGAVDVNVKEDESWPSLVLQLAHQYIKFNAAFISKKNIAQIMTQTCLRANSKVTPLTSDCVDVLMSILKFHEVPHELGILQLVLTACHLVSNREIRPIAYALTRTLLTSQYGLRSLASMLDVLEWEAAQKRIDLDKLCRVQRGVVYCLTNSFWSTNRIDNDVKISPTSIINRMSNLLDRDINIAEDVLAAILVLMINDGKILQPATWICISEVLQKLLHLCHENVEYLDACEYIINEMFKVMESLHKDKHLLAKPDLMYALVEKYVRIFSIDSTCVLSLIEFKFSLLTPSSRNFVDEAFQLVKEFMRRKHGHYRRDKVVEQVHKFYLKYKNIAEKEIVNEVIIPMLRFTEAETDEQVQYHLITVMLDVMRVVSMSSGGPFLDLCNFFRLILVQTIYVPEPRGGSEKHVRFGKSSEEQLSFSNLEVLVLGIQDVISSRWKHFTLPMFNVILDALVSHLFVQYSAGWIGAHGGEIRVRIFEILLSFYCCPISNNLIHWRYEEDRYVENTRIRRTPITSKPSANAPNNTRALVDGFCWNEICSIVEFSLRFDVWWPVGRAIIQRIGRILEYPETIRTAEVHNIEGLVGKLIEFYQSSKRFELDADCQKELVKYLPPVLSTLLTYTEKRQPQRSICMILIECARIGSCEAILACDVAIQLVPSVMSGLGHRLIDHILNLQPTAVRAIPIMELLSDAAEVVEFHQFFQEEHFKKVCSILSPYTNVHRFNTFIVSAMHRIMMRWFVRVPDKWKHSVRIHLEKCIEKIKNSPVVQTVGKDDDAKAVRKPSGDGRQVPGDLFMVGGQRDSESSESLDQCVPLKMKEEKLQNQTLYEIQKALDSFFKLPKIHDNHGHSVPPAPLCETTQEHYYLNDVIITVRTIAEKPNSPSEEKEPDFTVRSESQECLVNCSSSSSLNDPQTRPRKTSFFEMTRRRYKSAFSSSQKVERKSLVDMGKTLDDIYSTVSSPPREIVPVVNFTQLIVRHMYGKSSWMMRTFDEWPHDFETSLSLPPDVGMLMQHIDTMGGAKKLTTRPGDQEGLQRALRILDMKPAIENHAVGIVYIGAAQTSESEILANKCGSARYSAFLATLGKVTKLKNCPGGLQEGVHGHYTYQFCDEMSEITFLVATLMPTNLEKDKDCNMKKKLIGNNYVTIIWNESGTPFKLGQFCRTFVQVALEVTPQDEQNLLVQVHAKTEIGCWLAMRRCLVTDRVVARLLRKLTVRTQLSVNVWMSIQNGDNYISRGVDRLRKIQQIAEKYTGY
ncbi:unnamed protein product [Caenorhabditis auriculariae]|uniref:Rap-GAP domain-containing protein n=1 Tax=Caenorhabditis auriculariae TaxID=2777116 RepID=A0A8S1I0B8_9PELO|nr:unnamed protein product [Caenorhabditis auriculariae]